MKKTIAVLILMLAAVSQVFCKSVKSKNTKLAEEKPAAVKTEDTGMTIIIDEVQLTIPSGWSATRTGAGIIAIMYSPLEVNDQFRENITIGKETLYTEMTPKDYMEAALNYIKVILPDVEIIEDGEDYRVYTGTSQGYLVKVIQYIYIKDSIAYILTGTGINTTFDSYRDAFDKIRQSLVVED